MLPKKYFIDLTDETLWFYRGRNNDDTLAVCTTPLAGFGDRRREIPFDHLVMPVVLQMGCDANVGSLVFDAETQRVGKVISYTAHEACLAWSRSFYAQIGNIHVIESLPAVLLSEYVGRNWKSPLKPDPEAKNFINELKKLR